MRILFYLLFLLFLTYNGVAQKAEEYYEMGRRKANLENYQGAITDYSKAIELNPRDAMAYYGRGISKIMLGQKNSGCLDLSKAGELGEWRAYDVIKNFCN